MDNFDFDDRLRGRQTANDYDELDSNLSNRYGVHAPIREGHAVYYPPGTVGAGRPVIEGRTFKDIALLSGTPAYLRDYTVQNDSAFMPLWPYEIEVDMAVAGVTAQSRLKREFFPRHFIQPRFTVRCQSFNPYLYNKTTRFIRRHQLRQVAAGGQGTDARHDVMELSIRGTLGQPKRTTKGGYRAMKLLGYVEAIRAGAERFVQAPEFEFQFILLDSEDGIFQRIDEQYQAARIGDFMSMFGPKFLKDPKIDPPKAFDKPKDDDTGGPVAPPSQEEVRLAPNEAANAIGEAAGTIFDMLMGNE